jgi:DNA-binding MarR family transcriptional regulator
MMSTRAARRISPTDLAVEVRDAITRLNRRLRQTRPLGDLTIAQISALQSLDAAGALTPRELADLERVQPPTMTKIVARLEERGLVQRAPHPTDGRQVILSPTPAGRVWMDTYRRTRDEWLARRIGTLSAEDRETVRRAAAILAGLTKD